MATVRDESGTVRMRATVPTEAKAIVGLVKGFGVRVHVVFEEGTQAQWLHDLLAPHAERVVVCNIRGQRSETTNKSDRIDADWLSEQLRLGALRLVHHGSLGVATLKELVRCYGNLVEDSTRVMLRVKAIYRGRAIATSGEAVYRPSQWKVWLAKDVAGAQIEGASSNDRRGTTSVRMEDPALDPVPWAGSRRAVAGHRGYPTPVPYKAPALAVRGAGGGETIECRARDRRRRAASAKESAADAWVESQPQSRSEERFQRCGECGGIGEDGAIEGVI